jgi:DHA1 family bicyclomycin/chloramphenicol resistance-like MFS transporter
MASPQIKIRALFLLILLAAFPPLSTDMYLPALPSLAQTWHTSEAAINLTLVGFFVSFSLALLIYGPLSDRYGRKPVLIAGISIYVLACLICAQADSPLALIIGRVLQGIGAASASTLSLAMTKDYFEGAERERVLAHIAIIVALAPMLAPILGGVMMRFWHWSGIFYAQTVLGLIAIRGVSRLKEPAPMTSRSLGQVLESYFRLMGNPRFMALCALIALGMSPLFCFIAGSSFIYVTHFGLSEQVYSYFFAFNSAALMLGFWICGRLLKLKRIPSLRIITMGYIGILLGAVALALCSDLGPWGMALPMAVLTTGLGISRPPSSNFLLEQVKSDAGSASSLIMFTYFVSGAVAMWLIAQPWPNKILALALVGLGTSILVLVLLPILSKKRPA